MTYPIATPCIEICAMDLASGLCLGCGRTLDEIARWGSMSERERAVIMQELERRKTALPTTRR